MTVDEVLKGITVKDNIAKITSQQLDRPVYESVKKALEGIGGK